MATLSAFLSQNAIKTENKKLVVSKRFVDKDKNPVKWEIRCITSEEEEAIRRACTKRMPIVGKRSKLTTEETDYNLYLAKLAVKCVVFPNLDDAELQNSYGVMGSEALLKKMLTPGEYANLTSAVSELNDFDLETAIEEAKN